MRTPSTEFWVGAATRLGLTHKGKELVGPCPDCGGEDRFSVVISGQRKGIFNCRKCGGYRDILSAAGADGWGGPRSWNYKNRDSADISVKRKGDGKSKRIWREPSNVPGPYLPLVRGDTGGELVFAEGEKDADALLAAGFAAVCSIGGSEAISSTDWSSLSGRVVCVFPDNDEAGRSAGDELASILLKIGCNVRIADVDSLPEKGGPSDVSADEVARLIENAVSITSVVASAKTSFARPLDITDKDIDDFREPRHFIRGRIEEGTISWLIARPGAAKSTMAIAEIMALASGDAAPVGDVDLIRAPVLAIWSDEGDWAFRQKIMASMIHWGIAPERFRGQISRYVGRDGGTWSGMLTGENADDTANLIIENMLDYGARVLFIDSQAAIAPDAEMSNDAAEEFAARLQRICREADNASIRLLHHTRKGAGKTPEESDMEDARGAGAILAKTRIQQKLVAEDDDEHGTVHTLMTLKASNFRKSPPSTWRIEGVRINDHASGPVIVPFEAPSPMDGISRSVEMSVLESIGELSADHRLVSERGSGWIGNAVARHFDNDWGRAGCGSLQSPRTAEQNICRRRAAQIVNKWRGEGFLVQSTDKEGRPVLDVVLVS